MDVHRALRISVLPLVVACLAGCGGTAPSGRPCTLIGTRVGVALLVEAPLAAKVKRATMRVCWDGSCHDAELVLAPSTVSVPTPKTCGSDPGETCGALLTPDGGSQAFGDVPGLPKKAVRVGVALFDDQGASVLDREIEVTPKGAFPNGPDCGEGGPQAGVVADETGLRERA
ncbi:hypothetical protein AB0B89_10225 [Sphaerisporangium sp. NPDC049002]|uniref:hypothetical protein n=1 Tax=unclassified Sphaerisporangium TaxID=2630420 RepID=UPI0033DA2A67